MEYKTLDIMGSRVVNGVFSQIQSAEMLTAEVFMI